MQYVSAQQAYVLELFEVGVVDMHASCVSCNFGKQRFCEPLFCKMVFTLLESFLNLKFALFYRSDDGEISFEADEISNAELEKTDADENTDVGEKTDAEDMSDDEGDKSIDTD